MGPPARSWLPEHGLPYHQQADYPREIFNEMIERIERIGQCTMIPMISMISLLHFERIGNDWGNEMLNFQREPATQPAGLGASQEAPDHWTSSPMLPLPKCFYFQANPQRAKLAMSRKMTSSGLALGLAKTGIFRHFLSMPMIFVIRGCHEQ